MKKIILLLLLPPAHFVNAQISFTEVTGTPFEGVDASDIAFADIDNDNDQDVLIIGFDQSDQAITKLYTNDGSGNFTERTGTPFEGIRMGSIAFADIDNDNDRDVLITGKKTSSTIISKLYANDGNGNYTAVTGTPFEAVYSSSIAFADIDNDNDMDVLITGRNSALQGTSKLYANDGNGNFALVTGTPFEAVYAGSIAFADIDNDNDQDVLLTGTNAAYQGISKLYTNDGSGNFALVTGTPFEGVDVSDIAFADIDNDNDQDVLITGAGNVTIYIAKLYVNDGNGNFSELTGSSLTGVTHSAVAFADVDKDNDQDVLITGLIGYLQQISELYINDGNGNFILESGTPFDGVSTGGVAFANVDNDTYPDVLLTGFNDAYQVIANLYRNTSCIPGLSTHALTTCNSYTWIDGNTYTSSNNTATFIIYGGSANGCDSIITLNLTINSNTGTDVIAACDAYTWIDGNTYTSNNYSATHTLTNTMGCDSIITLNLTLTHASTGTDIITACDTYTWIDGNTYTASNNSATHTLTNASGCDSIVTLNLMLNHSTTGPDVITACDTYTWIDGNTYTASNHSATHILTNASGCDSIVTLDLTVNSSATGTDVITACDTYTWIDGNTYTASNHSAIHTLTNTAGCDSIVTLDLTVNSSATGTDVITACDSHTWIDGNNYTASNNTATHTLTTGTGCDSVVSLALTIDTVNVNVTMTGNSITANETGGTYQWLSCDLSYAIISGETAQSFTPSSNGDYAVEVIKNACRDTSACISISSVSITENTFSQRVSIFPNPNKGLIKIDLGNLKEVSLKLFSLSGKLLHHEQKITGSDYQLELNGAPGFYFLELSSNGVKQFYKVVKN